MVPEDVTGSNDDRSWTMGKDCIFTREFATTVHRLWICTVCLYKGTLKLSRIDKVCRYMHELNSIGGCDHGNVSCTDEVGRIGCCSIGFSTINIGPGGTVDDAVRRIMLRTLGD